MKYNQDIDLENLIYAMVQLLDDMGSDGTSVCLAAKAQARIAIEPFIDTEIHGEMDMPLDEAYKIMEELQ